MKKTLLFASVFTLALASTGFCKTDFAVVDFKECVEKSKQGNEEKQAFEALKKQMTASLEESDKELGAIAKKLEDQDYMDSLSPQAVEELKLKFQQLSQEFARNQNQYFQMMNQANYRMMQQLHKVVAQAADVVREDQDLKVIFSQDATFAFADSLDITEDVISEMNKSFKGNKTSLSQASDALPEKGN